MGESPMELFRKQALNAHNTRLRGDVMALPKVSHWLLTSALLLWLGLCVYWLITAQYARKETVRGWLKPTAGETRVYSDTTGIIKSMLVEEGDQVSAGESARTAPKHLPTTGARAQATRQRGRARTGDDSYAD